MSSSSIKPLIPQPYTAHASVCHDVFHDAIDSSFQLVKYSIHLKPFQQAVLYLWYLIYCVLGFDADDTKIRNYFTQIRFASKAEYALSIEDLLICLIHQVESFYYKSGKVQLLSHAAQLFVFNVLVKLVSIARFCLKKLSKAQLKMKVHDKYPFETYKSYITDDSPLLNYDVNDDDSDDAKSSPPPIPIIRSSSTPSATPANVLTTSTSSLGLSSPVAPISKFITSTPPSSNDSIMISKNDLNNILSSIVKQHMTPPPNNVNNQHERKDAYASDDSDESDDSDVSDDYLPPATDESSNPKYSRQVSSLASQFSQVALSPSQMQKLEIGCRCKASPCDPKRCGCKHETIGCTANCLCWGKKKCKNPYTVHPHYKKKKKVKVSNDGYSVESSAS